MKKIVTAERDSTKPFRLIDHYERELKAISVTVGAGHLVTSGLYSGTRAVSCFKSTVKIFQLEQEWTDEHLKAFRWGCSQKHFRPLILLRNQEIAITRWLKRQGKNVAVQYRGALLVAK